MKLVDHFDDFLAGTVNINPTRLGALESSVEALERFIAACNWEAKAKSFGRQGSWAHRTIIKPVDGRPFDADLLVMVSPVKGWDAKKYLQTLYAAFKASGVYGDLVKLYSHCVTIEYAGDRRIDLAPCVVDRLFVGTHEVCNARENAFEATEPELYTEWIGNRDGWAGKNMLRKVTRLLKFLRDNKSNFSCPSFLFTTLMGGQITSADEANETDFVDVPTALRTLVGRLDDWLQVRLLRPVVTNPVMPSEIISEVWTETQYGNFRDKIHKYREWVDDAYAETDRDESIGKWRKVFGDDFAKGEATDKAALISEASRTMKMSALAVVGAGRDLASLYAEFGRRALPSSFDRLPHKQRTRWKRAKHCSAVRIVASLHRADKSKVRDLHSDEEVFAKGQHLHFAVRTLDGYEPGADFEVFWRITNTDREASAAKCLRGSITRSLDGTERWESLAYRGVHSVEAFVVRRSDQTLVAESVPFYVAVG